LSGRKVTTTSSASAPGAGAAALAPTKIAPSGLTRNAKLPSPTIFVNGKKLQERSFEGFKAAVEVELKKG
jgi:hypothetical protein